MLAQVGNDSEGQEYLNFMRKDRISTDHVKKVEGEKTGSAFILSQKDGENSIILNGGANMHMPDTIDASWHQTIAKANILLL